VRRQETFSSSVIREKRSSMRASSGASGFRKSASPAADSGIPRLLSRIVSAVAVLAVASGATLSPRAASAEGAKSACVTVHAEAPYRGSGYDHLVKLENHCEKPVRCRVSSDVNPEPQEVTVPAKGRAEVLLWRGSPASTFKARVSCE
jgi:hypothetical protein